MIKTHFVYRITQKNPKDLRKYYVGKRSGFLDDFETGKYKTSSKAIKEDFNMDDFWVKIVKEFSTQKEALNFEIKYHKRLNVQDHPLFFNQQNQTSTTFDSTNRVTVIVKETNERMTISTKEFNKNKHLYESVVSGLVQCKDIRTNETLTVTQEEFDNNEFLKGVNYGLQHVRLKETNELVTVPKGEYAKNPDKYISSQCNIVSQIDTETWEFVSIPKEEFDGNKYVGVNTGRKWETKECLLCKREVDITNFDRHVESHSRLTLMVKKTEKSKSFKCTEKEFYENNYLLQNRLKESIWMHLGEDKKRVHISDKEKFEKLGYVQGLPKYECDKCGEMHTKTNLKLHICSQI